MAKLTPLKLKVHVYQEPEGTWTAIIPYFILVSLCSETKQQAIDDVLDQFRKPLSGKHSGDYYKDMPLGQDEEILDLEGEFYVASFP